MKYTIAQQTALGTRKTNQDRAGFAERENSVLMVLADGLGGYAGGELAAETFVDNIIDSYERINSPTIADPIAFIVLTIAHSHSLINRRAKQADFKSTDPRTTAVTCLIQDGYAYWGHVGDSRLYHFRDGRMLSRTEDHSTSEQMRVAGAITEDDMRAPELQGHLLRCVGGPKRPVVTLGPETPLQRDDVIFMCSDGLWRAFPIDDISQRLDSVRMEYELDDLIRRAERKIRKDCDNMTGVALRWESDLTDRKPLAPDGLGEKEQEQLWREAQYAHRQKIQRPPLEPSRENPMRDNVRRDTIELVIEELEAYIGNIDRNK